MSKAVPNLNFVSRQHWLVVSNSFKQASLYGVLLGALALSASTLAAELPTSLVKAVEQAGTEDAEQAFGTLRRYAYTDNIEQRLAARVALSEMDRNAGRLDRAATWVADYQNPQLENFEWPRVQAYVEAAKIRFLKGNAFESVKRLTDAEEKASGLAKISIERALSWVVEQKPELQQALDYEKAALKTGEGYFKRERISESEGLEPPKPGTDVWKGLKPVILERIAILQRKLEIDQYGLDYILYREAQEYRNASHPLAMDFTNVAAAFDQEGQIGGTVPDANYEMAEYRYNEIIQFFPENPYGQAAKLYLAVCAAKTGDPDGAIKQLKDFYKEDPDGLYRGEALKLIGDLYLFAKWDKNNAHEAYSRAINWISATKERTRVLDKYLVPSKSLAVSKPPKVNKRLSDQGLIIEEKNKRNYLINRITADWYLDKLHSEVEWRLSYLSILDDDWEKAHKHMQRMLNVDKIIAVAQNEGFFNPYMRFTVAMRNKSLVAMREQQNHLLEKELYVIKWADLQFIMSNFNLSYNLYGQIKKHSSNIGRIDTYARAYLGEILTMRQMGMKPKIDIENIQNFVLENPKSPSSPALLIQCAELATQNSLPTKSFLEWAATYSQSKYSITAQYYIIVMSINKVPDYELHKSIKDFKKKFPNEVNYHRALARLTIKSEDK